MVVQASVVLAKAYATCGAVAHSSLDRVFFVGGFVGAEQNNLARTLIAKSMRQVSK